MRSNLARCTRQSLLLRFLMANLIVLLNPGRIFANGLGAGLGFFPGLAPIDFFCGPLLTVAVAFIERPFFARAGLTPWTLIHSLRANFVSYLLGIVVALAYISAAGALVRDGFEYGEFLLPGLPLLLIVVSIWVEERLAVRVLAPKARLRTRWIVVGNVVSNLALLAVGGLISSIVVSIESGVHNFTEVLEDAQIILVIGYLGILLGAILLALGVPLWALLPPGLQAKWGVPAANSHITVEGGDTAMASASLGSIESQTVNSEVSC